MKFFSLVERVLLQLSNVPGLGFLYSYVREFYSRQADVSQQVGHYRSYVSSVRGAGADVAQAVRGPQEPDSNDDDADGDSDVADETYDDESFMQ